jgi:hypothetical protein
LIDGVFSEDWLARSVLSQQARSGSRAISTSAASGSFAMVALQDASGADDGLTIGECPQPANTIMANTIRSLSNPRKDFFDMLHPISMTRLDD